MRDSVHVTEGLATLDMSQKALKARGHDRGPGVFAIKLGVLFENRPPRPDKIATERRFGHRFPPKAPQTPVQPWVSRSGRVQGGQNERPQRLSQIIGYFVIDGSPHPTDGTMH